METSLDSDKVGIVFFDGVCGICNSFVDFLIKRDSENKLSFAPLQGQTADDILLEKYTEDLQTLVFKKSDKLYFKSDAAILAINEIGGFWKLILILRVFPRFIRDWVYSFIAKNRYRWFGKKKECRIPSPSEREKILP